METNDQALDEEALGIWKVTQTGTTPITAVDNSKPSGGGLIDDSFKWSVGVLCRAREDGSEPHVIADLIAFGPVSASAKSRVLFDGFVSGSLVPLTKLQDTPHALWAGVINVEIKAQIIDATARKQMVDVVVEALVRYQGDTTPQATVLRGVKLAFDL